MPTQVCQQSGPKRAPFLGRGMHAPPCPVKWPDKNAIVCEHTARELRVHIRFETLPGGRRPAGIGPDMMRYDGEGVSGQGPPDTH